METLVKENQQEVWKNKSPHQDLTNILTWKIYQRLGIGEISITLTGFHGQEINTFLNIVEAVGLMELPVQLPIELILFETELGQIWI